MIGVLFAVLSAVGFGLANGISQRYVRDLGVFTALFARSIVTSLILIVLFVLIPHELSLTGLAWATMVTGLGILAVLSFYKALDVGVSGIVAPIANSAVIVTVIVGALFFSEALGPLAYALIAIIIFGSVLLSRDGSGTRAAGIVFALGATVLWGLTYALLPIPTAMIGPIATPLAGEILALAVAGTIVLYQRRPLPARKDIMPLTIIGVSIVFGVSGFTFALATVPAGVVAAISAANPAVTALYMRIVHGESLTAGQRFGSLIVIVGIVVLSFIA